jgi:antitoxin (DNA-binding transcriptional repressor) of toxin-antitoxin stability system
MKKVSIRDLHMRTGAVVREAAGGETIIIEKRGIAVAELRRVKKLTAAEVFRERERSGFFKKLPKTGNWIDRFISEDRDR